MTSLVLLLAGVIAMNYVTGIEGRSVSHVISKRSDDLGSFETVVTSLTSDVSMLKAQLAATEAKVTQLQNAQTVEARHSSFLAHFSQGKYYNPTAGPFRFDSVARNDGNNYDSVLGTYTAPYSGLYLISYKIYLSTNQTIHPVLQLMVNGHSVDQMAFDEVSVRGGYGDLTNCHALPLHLTAGNKVWVETAAHRVYESYGGSAGSFFAAALLASD